MKRQFKISYKNQLSVASHAWISLILLVILYTAIFGTSLTLGTFVGFGFYFFISLGPAIFLHTQYYFLNKNVTIFVDVDQKEITYQRGRKAKTTSFSEIESLENVVSYGGGKVAPGWYGFGPYTYSAVNLKNGSAIIFTRLMNTDIPESLELILKRPSVRKAKLLATISRNYKRKLILYEATD